MPITKTLINVPQAELFYDILVWMYTKDEAKIQKAFTTIRELLSIIQLASYLKMIDEFYDMLLLHVDQFKVTVKDFETILWSRISFPFTILDKLIQAMKLSNEQSIIAICTWLKEDTININGSNEDTAKEREIELCTSIDYFLARKHIKVSHSLDEVDPDFLLSIMKEFPHLVGIFDCEAMLKQYAYMESVKIYCKICKQRFSSPFQVIAHSECTGKLYHPQSFITTFRGLQEKSSCNHLGCNKKIQRNEFACCHRNATSEGCAQGEGKHFIIFEKE